MALTELQLANKRTRKVMRRRSKANARYRNAMSHRIGRQRWRMRLDAEALAERNAIYEAAQLATKKALEASRSHGKRSGFMDHVKAGLRKLLPRRTGGAD